MKRFPAKSAVLKFQDHLDSVNRAIFHPDGTCLASCSDDHSVKIWDLRRRRLIQHYDAHNGAVLDIDFAYAGAGGNVRDAEGNVVKNSQNFLVSSGVDRAIKLWDLQVHGQKSSFDNPLHNRSDGQIPTFG